MTRKEHYDDQIALCKAALAVSEGSVYAVVRAHLIELYATVCRMTGREGQEIVE